MEEHHDCDFETFKQEVKKFVDRVRDKNIPDNMIMAAKSSLTHSYLNMSATTNETNQAAIALQLAFREMAKERRLY